MLELPDVTLACVDTANPDLALRALRLSGSRVRFASTLFFTDRTRECPGIDVRPIERLASRESYSEFVLKDLVQHVDTAYVLLIQWDGYVIRPEAWRDEFLACDYIGAKWFWHDASMSVGNGGFSLRSRKLLEALQDRRIELRGAEDETICRAYRPLLEKEHGIVFGSETLADAFAFEVAYPTGPTFGFHGLFNFCRVVSDEELAALVPLFGTAIARSPQLLQLGRNCMALGQWGAAEAIFRCISRADPIHVEAAKRLEVATRNAMAGPRVGRNDPCPCGSGKRYKHCHGVPAAGVADASPQHRLQEAIALHRSGNRDDRSAAEAIYREVLTAQPDNATAQHFLGVIHYQRGELDLALPLLERAAAATPSEAEFHNNLGLALAALDRTEHAIAEYRAALRLRPSHAVAWNNLGLALQEQNEVHAAIDAFRRALALAPDFAHARWNLSLALLLDRQFAEGWREYDARLALGELGRDRQRLPGVRWDGSTLAGGTLLLVVEQGLGDAFQFVRYAGLLAAAGVRCVIRCPAALAPLLETVPGVSAVSVDGTPLPAYDAYLPLLSAPGMLGTTPETIPATVPYIAVPEPRRAAARTMLYRTPARRRIGLRWAGNLAYANDRNRSMTVSVFEPLLELADITWYSLQDGEAAEQLAVTPHAAHVVPLAPQTPFVDTAALIAELDLVVTSDTAIAHLAGALAKPTWVIVPFAPDWRWQLGRDDSPWYPTMRLFRPRRVRDWRSAVESIRDELHTLVAT